MTSPIIDFIEARLAEDEAAARTASASPWHDDHGCVSNEDFQITDYGSYLDRHGENLPIAEAQGLADSAFIVRFQPARVLREVAAKRAILAEHSTPHTLVDGFCTECGGFLPDGIHKRDRSYCEIHGWRECETVIQLAAIWSDHPDFDPNWSTT